MKLAAFSIISEPSLDVSSYFDNYDELVTSKELVIIISQSGKLSKFGTITDLIHVLERYTAQSPDVMSLPPIWVDIQYPNTQVMEALSTVMEIHSLTVEDCLAESEQEHQKTELFSTYRFVSFAEHHVVPGTNFWNSVDAHLIISLNSPVIIGLHNGPVSYVAAALNRIQAMRPATGMVPNENKRVIRTKPGKCHIPSASWMVYVILDEIVDLFFTLVEECSVEVSHLDNIVHLLHAREQTDLLRRVGEARRRIGVLRQQLVRKLDILTHLLEESKELKKMFSLQPSHFISAPATPTVSSNGQEITRPASAMEPIKHPIASPAPSTAPSSVIDPIAPSSHNSYLQAESVTAFLRDIQDHVVTLLSDLDQAKENLMSITSTYLGRVGIEMASQANKQNSIMKKFSAMATVVLPMTFVTALYGMNIPVPYEFSNSPWPFVTIAITLFIFGIIMSMVFWKIKWF